MLVQMCVSVSNSQSNDWFDRFCEDILSYLASYR